MTDSTFKTSTLDHCRAASQAKRETNDCTVKALAAATGESYDKAHAALAKHGRPYRKGPSAQRIRLHGRNTIVCPALTKAADDMGYELRVMSHQEFTAKTMITATRDSRLAAGNYICMVRGHVAAVVDGEVIDWTDGRRHRIQEVYEITRKAQKAAPTRRKAEPMKAMTTFSQGRLF